jgi:plasmid stability protein
MTGYDEGMKKRDAAKKPAWKSSAGILAGKVEITGDIVNFDTSELWNALRPDDPQTDEMIRILSAGPATQEKGSSKTNLSPEKRKMLRKLTAKPDREIDLSDTPEMRELSSDAAAGRFYLEIDDETKSKLRLRAARSGHSMEQEAREILRHSLASESSSGLHLVDAIRRRIEPLGGVELPVIPRQAVPEPLKLDE